MSQIGKLEAFHPHEDNWQEYWDMVEQYFIANGIETFLTVIGRGLLFSLTAQRKPSSMLILLLSWEGSLYTASFKLS